MSESALELESESSPEVVSPRVKPESSLLLSLGVGRAKTAEARAKAMREIE